MTIDSPRAERASATIYQFPVGGRKGVEAAREQAVDLSAHTAGSSFGSWYHEAAIQESKRPQ
ncbi:MAG TPA: DUF2735 domain-containing protein [Xanthobacteraceae bacterium]|jgi:hypothetical protein|nr:DUF2735 domain-containing protein [Xanthobacteraceae bacterium]